MSTFDNEDFLWRETYFVLFDAKRRPLLADVQRALKSATDRVQFANASADDEGRIESLTILAPEDFAALDISYESGDSVREQVSALNAEMKRSTVLDPGKLDRLPKCNARLDVMHFEQVGGAEDEGDPMSSMFDPSSLLIVMETLVTLTDGLGVDPQTGMFV